MARHSTSASGVSALPTTPHADGPASIHIPDVSGKGGPPATTAGSSAISFASPAASATQTMLRTGPRRRSPGGISAAPSPGTSRISQLGFGPAIILASRVIQAVIELTDRNSERGTISASVPGPPTAITWMRVPELSAVSGRSRMTSPLSTRNRWCRAPSARPSTMLTAKTSAYPATSCSTCSRWSRSFG